jgi:hypothetical protein
MPCLFYRANNKLFINRCNCSGVNHLHASPYFCIISAAFRASTLIQETATDPVYQSVQEFNVVGDSTVVSFTGDANLDKLIFSLRVILRDNNPDRNYRARPPASEKFIQSQTQVFYLSIKRRMHLLERVLESCRNPKQTRVSEIMTRNVITGTPNMDRVRATRMMFKLKVKNSKPQLKNI